MKVKFNPGNPEKWLRNTYLVKCPDYTPLGYCCATWDGEQWWNDYGDITEYVIGWVLIEEN